MIAAITRLVEASRRYAIAMVLLVLAATVAGAIFTARHIAIDTDVEKLISRDLPWRQVEAQMDREFPQNDSVLAIVIDAKTPDQAADATATIAARLRAQPELFSSVRLPGGGSFFEREGLLFLPQADVQKIADGLISAQPMLGTLAADPTLRGVFTALDLLAKGAGTGDIDPARLATPFNAIAGATEAALAGKQQPLSWQTLLSGRKSDPRELRRFIVAKPILDYGALQPGARAVAAIHAAAADTGARVRVTGPVALSDDQFATLSEGAGFSTSLSLGLLCLWLFLALRSPRLVLAILITLVVGLVACATFAAGIVGPLNPISLAFAVLFVGIAVDFGIQFGVRYRDERLRAASTADALLATARGIGGPIAVAAAASSVGFFSFVPTDYTGVSELGIIAGVGMLIALVLNLTLLPALLSLLGPKGQRRPLGAQWAAPINRFLVARRVTVVGACLLVAAAALVTLNWLTFDFNPLNLQNQHTEAMTTIHDLTADPDSTPETIDVLADSPAAASALAAKIAALPEVSRVLTVQTFVPEDQQAKLAIIQDAQSLLGPTLSPPSVDPAPSDSENLAAIAQCIDDLKPVAARNDAAAGRLLKALQAVMARGSSVLPALSANLTANVSRRIEDLRQALSAEPVTLETLPAELKRDWIAPDGKARLQVYPKGDARDNAVLQRFADAVRKVAPNATGAPITIQESARTITHAFITAGIIAVIAIAVLLLVVLRRPGDVVRVLLPLLFAGLLTLATTVVAGLPLNFANIITLPLLLGVGVAFDIYFVMRWRGGDGDLLQSTTARAVLFSALTTGTAFGSLALSSNPGIADMGKLLTLALFFTLASTFILLPSLLGPVPGARQPAGAVRSS
jgi:hopanoid biosynthesis associated RND transporter like protein HpnN